MHYRNNSYDQISFDITYDCNLNCNLCYNKKNMLNQSKDMSLDYFKNCLRQLPKNQKIVIRLMGGEPTLHPQLKEFIKESNKYGHTAMIGTNGIRFADSKYIEELKNWKDKTSASKNLFYAGGEYPFCVYIDLGGGTTHNLFYKIFNDKKCLEQKLEGLQNIIDIGISSIAITGIIARGLNEEVIPELLELAYKHKEIRRIHFRSVSDKGNTKLKEKSYSITELKHIVKEYIPEIDTCKPLPGYIPPDGKKCYNCCYRFIHKGVSINLIDFASENSAKCWKRGYDNGDYTISPFFEKIRRDG